MNGEGFAFFRWAIDGYRTGRCKPASAGWGCWACRYDWENGYRG